MRRSYEDNSDKSFVDKTKEQLVDPTFGKKIPNNRLRGAQLIGMNSLILKGQKARLSASVGMIAAAYNPDSYVFDPEEEIANSKLLRSWCDGHKNTRADRTVEGRYLYDLGLPDLYVDRFTVNNGSKVTTRVALHYLDPKRGPFSLEGSPDGNSQPALSFRQEDCGEPFDLNHINSRAVRGLAGLSIKRREGVVTAVSVVADALCSANLKVVPYSPY